MHSDHLDHCERCRRLVSALAATGYVSSGEATEIGAEAGLRAGHVLGRFVLTRLLGHGSMGEVWAAHDPELDREVALKMLRLRAGALGVEAKVRLRREAQAMARLNHPNVVAIYELGTDGDRVFCAMELVDGVTLRRWLAAPRSWREVAGVAAAIGRGIAAAHAVGLIHRDIKPENVLIASDGRTLVSDFGLAKLADLGSDADDAERGHAGGELVPSAPIGALTATGAMVGTPRYMAPEQLVGRAADARTDQFSYCVTIHEALFGSRPFAGETIDELAAAIRRGPARQRAAGVPGGVVRCLARGLAADPAARWRSMTALVDQLERAARRPRQRRTAMLFGGVAVAVAGIAAATAAGFVAHMPDPLESASRAAEQRIAAAWNPAKRAALEARFLATGAPLAPERAAVTTRLLDGYRAAWMSHRLEAWSATHVRGEQTEEVLGSQLACLGQLADALEGLVGVFLAAGARDMDEAPQSVYRLEPIATCDRVDRLLERSMPPRTPAALVADRQLRELEALHRAGRHAEALQRSSSLVALALQLGAPAVAARARFDLGAVQATGGRFVEAEATLRLALQEAAAVRDHYLVAECWLQLLNVIGAKLLHRDAAAAIEPAARAAVAQAGNDPRQLADLAKMLGLVAVAAGDSETAHVQFAEARNRRIAARGPDDPSVATDEANLGGVLLELGQRDEAAEHFERAITIIRGALGEHHPAIVGAEHNLATIAADRKDWATAERHARAAVAMNMAIAGADYPGTATNRIHLARMLREQHRFGEARAELALAHAGLVRSLPATHPSVILFDLYPAQVDDAEGHHDQAIALARRVVDAARRSGVPPLLRVWALGELATMVGHRAPRDALPILDEALRLYSQESPAHRRGDRDLLQQLAELALQAHQPQAALRWFDRMPELAKQLPDVRDQLEVAARRHH